MNRGSIALDNRLERRGLERPFHAVPKPCRLADALLLMMGHLASQSGGLGSVT